MFSDLGPVPVSNIWCQAAIYVASKHDFYAVFKPEFCLGTVCSRSEKSKRIVKLEPAKKATPAAAAEGVHFFGYHNPRFQKKTAMAVLGFLENDDLKEACIVSQRWASWTLDQIALQLFSSSGATHSAISPVKLQQQTHQLITSSPPKTPARSGRSPGSPWYRLTPNSTLMGDLTPLIPASSGGGMFSPIKSEFGQGIGQALALAATATPSLTS